MGIRIHIEPFRISYLKDDHSSFYGEEITTHLETTHYFAIYIDYDLISYTSTLKQAEGTKEMLEGWMKKGILK